MSWKKHIKEILNTDILVLIKEISEDAVEIDKYYLNFKIVKTDKTDIYKLYLVEKIMN